jgi:hypothetical protein
VACHARAEEREEFAAIADELDGPQLDYARRAVELWQSQAPRRLHPEGASAARRLVGPYTTMLARVHELIASAAARQVSETVRTGR